MALVFWVKTLFKVPICTGLFPFEAIFLEPTVQLRLTLFLLSPLPLPLAVSLNLSLLHLHLLLLLSLSQLQSMSLLLSLLLLPLSLSLNLSLLHLLSLSQLPLLPPLSSLWGHLHWQRVLKPAPASPSSVAINTMLTFYGFPFPRQQLVIHRLEGMLGTYVFISCLLTVEFSFAKGAGVLVLSTYVVILCLIAMHLDITHFAYMSLYYMDSFLCVCVDYVLYQLLSSLELLSTRVTFFFVGSMGCVNMIH